MQTFNKYDSMIKAGYSEKTAACDQKGVFGKPEVQAEIRRRQNIMSTKAQINAEWVIEKLREIVDAPMIGSAYSKGKDGKTIYLDPEKVTDEHMKFVSEIIEEQYTEGRGGDGKDVIKIKVKGLSQADRLTALEKIAKHLGMYITKVELDDKTDAAAYIMRKRKQMLDEKDAE